MDGWIRYYSKDVFPRVWQRIDELIDGKMLIGSREVLLELQRKEDELTAWARDREDMFIPIDTEIQVALQEILRRFPRLVDTRRDRSGADPWVIALAKSHNCSVVTGEKPSGTQEKPNIPDVCEALEIPCLNLLQMFREQKWAF
jgi:hypothetical protein